MKQINPLKARTTAKNKPIPSTNPSRAGTAAMTQGRATYTMQFDHYQKVPERKYEEIVADIRT